MSEEISDAPVESTTEEKTPQQAAPAASSSGTVTIESPPPAARPERSADFDPRARLHQLAAELMRNRNRRLLIEFLQLRRALLQ